MTDEPRANTSAEVVLKWGDGSYLFSLKGRQIEHLQKACGAGIGVIAARLMRGEAYYADIRMTVQLGLEGGGMPPTVVAEKMDRFFDGQPLAKVGDPSSPIAMAQVIIGAVWFGMEDLQQGEARAGESPADLSASRDTEQHFSTAKRTRRTATRTPSMKSSRRSKR